MYDLSKVNERSEETKVALRNDDNPDYAVDLTSAKKSYSSLAITTPEEKAIAFNAMNSPQFKVIDKVKETIMLKDIYVETVNCVNEKDGTIAVCPRIVLVDTEGNAYSCVSVGMFSSLHKLIQVYGEPTWHDGLPVTITHTATRSGYRVLGLKIV